MNTTLAIGHSTGKGFDQWRAYCRAHPDLNISRLMQRTCPNLTLPEAQAYHAPFPDASYKAGVRRFPEMVMTAPNMEGVAISKRAVEYLSNAWQGQSFMAVGMRDPALLEIADGGHFLQEWGGPVAEATLRHWGDIK